MAESVENLARVWASIERLCATLSEADWKRPTALPAWSVQDNVSHLVDWEARFLGRPAPGHVPPDLAHTRNPLGEANEAGVDYRRKWPGERVLAEFREVTRARVAALRSLGPEELAQPTQTPTGPGTVADLLRMRVMDSWVHEQDIRSALGRPGHIEGPVVKETIGHFARALPYILAKRAEASEGSVVVLEVRGMGSYGAEVTGGRGRAVDPGSAEPDVVLRADVLTVSALITGRPLPEEAELQIEGDEELARRILANFNVML